MIRSYILTLCILYSSETDKNNVPGVKQGSKFLQLPLSFPLKLLIFILYHFLYCSLRMASSIALYYMYFFEISSLS